MGIYLYDINGNAVSWIQPGQPVGVAWTVWNDSSTGTGDFTDTLVIDGVSPEHFPGGGLSAGEPFTESIWYPYGFSAGNHTLEVQLDSLNDVTEGPLNENNNYQYSGILVGL